MKNILIDILALTILGGGLFTVVLTIGITLGDSLDELHPLPKHDPAIAHYISH